MDEIQIHTEEIIKEIIDKFDALIIKEGAPQTVKWGCWCCHKNYSSKRRDMSWNFSVFLLVLSELERETKEHFHKSSVILAECEKRYNISPSDHPFLRTKWNCTLHPTHLKGGQNAKYVGLTKTGYDYLNFKTELRRFFYTEPVTGISRFSKTTISFRTVIQTDLQDKDPKNPFFNKYDF